jgi:hypothetical protein
MKTLKQFQEAATGYRKVKSPDEQKFIDKHEVETVPDKNGNGDEVFKASNVKKVERKKERKGYEPGEDESVYEEAEQIDELSQDKLMAYRSAAKKQGSGIQDRMKVGGGDWSKDGKDTKTLKKRMSGYKMAGRKVNPGLAASMGKAPRVAANEEVEQVDEGLGGAYRYNQMMKRKRNEYLGMVKKHQDAGHDLQTAKNKASQELDALEAKRRKNARPLPQTRDLMKKEEFEQAIEGLSPRLQETMYNIHDRLNEENRDKFVAACQTEEGLEKMIAFAIENRGE